MSTITTHILDTTKGKPAAGISIILYKLDNAFTEIARGTTNSDGRIPDLLPKDKTLAKGIYKMRFEVKPYFEKDSITTFYPFVEITFEINSNGHYHVPLLLNPFGYSTYRGS